MERWPSAADLGPGSTNVRRSGVNSHMRAPNMEYRCLFGSELHDNSLFSNHPDMETFVLIVLETYMLLLELLVFIKKDIVNSLVLFLP